STSLVCAVVAGILLWAGKYLGGMRQPIMGVLVCIAISSIFLRTAQIPQVNRSIFGALGRNETLTGRTEIWRIVREQNTNPVVGTGFQSFWSSHYGIEAYDQLRDVNIRTAHNGYLETYLDGGAVGVVLL